MKKRLKDKSSLGLKQDQPDIADLILKVQQQLSFLEKKIDTLIAKPPEKPFKEERHSKPFQRFDHSNRQREAGPDNNYRQRLLHKAICADCNKECEVPFKPSQDRPVYCKDCFSKRKTSGPFKGKADNRPWQAGPAQASHINKPHGGEKKRFFEKKRPSVKRRKTRA